MNAEDILNIAFEDLCSIMGLDPSATAFVWRYGKAAAWLKRLSCEPGAYLWFEKSEAGVIPTIKHETAFPNWL